MPRHVAFLRAVNVGGRIVKMEALRACFESMGFTNVSTYIASGNVIFQARALSEAALARRIEAGLGPALGFEVPAFVRRADEVLALARYQPFTAAERAAALDLNVGFLAAPLTAAQGRALADLATAFDAFQVHGREVYWLCLGKQSESKFSNVAFERAVGARATFRRVSSVIKLAELLTARPRGTL